MVPFTTAGVTAVNPVDLAVWQWMLDHRSGPATSFFKAVTSLCNPITVVVITALVGIGLLVSGRTIVASRLIVSVAGAWVTATVVKLVIGRNRPPVADRLVTVSEYSFPSGHATQSVALWTSLALVTLAVVGRHPRPSVRAAATVVAFLIALAVGVSRLYLGVHWLTDVLAGWTVGAAWVSGCWWGVDRWLGRAQRPTDRPRPRAG